MPRLRSLAAPAAVLALALAAPAGASADGLCPDADLVPAASNLPRIADATLCLLNEERAAHGLSAITENELLTRASADYSLRLVRESFFAHEAPDGTDLVDRLSAVGYIHWNAGAWSVGENLAWAQGSLSTPANVMRAWMKSPGHRANILKGEFREVGLGIVMGTPVPGPPGATFTTDFGRRDGAPPAPSGAPNQAPASGAVAATARPASRRPAARKSTRKAAKRTVRKRTSRSRRSARRARKTRAVATPARAQRRSAARRARAR